MNQKQPVNQAPRGPAENAAASWGRATAQPRPAWVDRLMRAGVVVPDAASVARFVERFPETVRVMDDGLSHVHHYFQDAIRVVLETFDEGDESGDPNEQTLLMVVELKSPAPDALKRLEQLDEEWWYKLPRQTMLRVGAHVTLR